MSRDALAQALGEAVAEIAGVSSDEADKVGPPQAVFWPAALPGVRCECRPLSREPKDATVTIFYRPVGTSLRQAGVGIFRGGTWRVDGKRKAPEADWLWSLLVRADG